MLSRLFKQLAHMRASPADTPEASRPLKLHIGGRTPHPDWKIVDVKAGEHTDYVGSCTDLTQFADGSVAEIYASHVLEHLGYQKDLPRALAEFRRVLVPDGLLRVSVPDLTTLCQLFLSGELDTAARFHVMRMMFGGQLDDADFHLVGLNEEFLAYYLRRAGFVDVRRVESLGLFQDSSVLVFAGRPISLNMVGHAPASC